VTAAEQQDAAIGPFKLDRRNRSLTRDGVPVPLGGRALDLLDVLAAAAGETVAKDTLLDQVWPGLKVEENNLQVQISAVRKALGKGWIVTVPGRGYRLVTARPGEALIFPPQPAPSRPSIAVLPFANLSDDPANEYFSDGMADDIITELSRSRSLFVIARNSAFTYKGQAADLKQVSRELGVRYVMEGSLRREGDRVRINAQLIDAETGNHLWAERYDRDVREVFAVQDQITAAVVMAVEPAITNAEQQRVMRKPPENLSAWESYQRGLWYQAKHNPSDNAGAEECFARAAVLDSTFISPLVAMAIATYDSGMVFATRSLDDATERGLDWSRRAIEIDPTDADAQFARGQGLFIAGDTSGALECLNFSTAVNPNSARANFLKGTVLSFTGNPSEARDAMSAGLRLNPRDFRIAVYYLNQVALTYYLEGDYAQAADTARRAVARYVPVPRPYRWLAAALGQLGQTDEAREALREAIEVSPQSFHMYVRDRPRWFRPEDHEHMLAGLRKAGWHG
jgi:adenylate cyclase